MQYTFEISLAGCNTNCLHCYVDGGPSKHMSYEDYIICIEKLKPLLDCLKGEISVTLGNELPNHPKAKDIILNTYRLMPQYYSHDVVGITTTGLAIMGRSDRDEIMMALLQAKARDACLTLHGDKLHHNEIVRNPDAFDAIVKAAEYFNSYQIDLYFSIILSKYVVEDWEAISRFLLSTPHSRAFIVIPTYLPIARLREYQQVRAEYDDCMKLKGRLSRLGIDEDEFFNQVESGCEAAIAYQLKNGFDYKEAENSCPNWAFFNIDRNLDLYYGNAGVHTKLLGNLKTSSTEELFDKVSHLKANYDYSAFYDIDSLPSIQSVLQKVQPLHSNYVYSEVSYCLYRWFDLCKIPSIICK